jgi:CubicO group peptidase (beta-lactamase class C family)
VKYKLRINGLVLMAALVASCGIGDSSPATRTVDADALSRAGLTGEGVAAVQDMMDVAVADGRITASVAMLARGDQIAWTGTSGEMTPGIPMRDDAILPLASVGKMFTAVAAMILYERGDIALDDPVSDYIPEFANAKVAVVDEAGNTNLVDAETPITIYHLLTHTAGLVVTGDEFWSVWDAHVARTTTTHFARDLVRLPLHSQPGETYRYGQTGAAYEVLGAVIEIASGQTLEVFMTENVFEPLGLEDSSFYLPAEKSERLPEVYRRVDGALELDRPFGEDFSRSTFFHGGGGVRSAPADIHRFARLFLDGGTVDGVKILERETVAMMMSDQLGDKAPPRWQERGLSWGFGAAVHYKPGQDRSGPPNRYGWVGGGFAKLWVEPNSGLVAYLNFPLTPPGDNDLLAEFEYRVIAMSAAPGSSN